MTIGGSCWGDDEAYVLTQCRKCNCRLVRKAAVWNHTMLV